MSKEIKLSEIISWESRHLDVWVRAKICWDIPTIYPRMTESTWAIPDICHRAALVIFLQYAWFYAWDIPEIFLKGNPKIWKDMPKIYFIYA